MRHLFVMDPLDRIHVSGDSTYITMLECSRRGHQVWMCVPGDLMGRCGEALARATPVRTTEEAPFFHTGDAEDFTLGHFDVVWMRKDPPFDMHYVFSTYLLDMAPPSTLVVNDPAGLKLFNEKMWALRFPDFHPETLVSNNIERLSAFVKEQPGKAVIKPWDGNGGRGVLITHGADKNLRSMIEVLSANGRDYVIAQRYLPGVEKGDKRILLFDGEPVGAMLRVPGADDHRGNMHVGASVQPTELDERDVEICQVLGPELKRHGQVFVGIDVIEGHLTEINVTSPTGIREMNTLYNTRLEATLVDAVLARLATHRSRA